MMEAVKADRASQGGDRKSKDSAKLLKPTLKEVGIDGNLAHRCRSAAAMSDKDFAEYVEDHRASILEPIFQAAYPESEEQKAERLAERREDRKRRKEELAKRRAEMHAADAIVEDEPSNIEPSPVIDIVVEDVKAEPQAIKIDIVKNGTQSAAPEIISPTFTTKGAVNQTRFAEVMRCTKQHLRSAYALSNRATFFKHVRDMIDDLERELVPRKCVSESAEQSVEERRALNAKLAEADESSTQTA